MNLDALLTTLDAVLDGLPEDIDQEHSERLKAIRDILNLIITARKLHSKSTPSGVLLYTWVTKRCWPISRQAVKKPQCIMVCMRDGGLSAVTGFLWDAFGAASFGFGGSTELLAAGAI